MGLRYLVTAASPILSAVPRARQAPGPLPGPLFPRAARDAGIAVSMGSRGDGYDNAVAETFFATLKKGLVDRRS